MANRAFNDFINNSEAAGLKLLYAQLRSGGQITDSFNLLPEQLRLNTYSLCKSVVGLTAGFAQQEGLISLDDKVCDILPDYVQPHTSSHLLECRVRHLLTMSSGLGAPLFFADMRDRYFVRDWAAYYFSVTFPHRPGTVFMYSNFNTYMVGRCIERRFGQPLLEYLRPRFFEPLGIGNPDWFSCPLGHTAAAYGLHVTIDEIGRFGEFVLRGGQWNGKQLLDEAYVREATSSQIDTLLCPASLREVGFDPSLFQHGYGYQFWKTPLEGTILSFGNYGQICLVMPDKNMVFCCQSFAGGPAAMDVYRLLLEAAPGF